MRLSEIVWPIVEPLFEMAFERKAIIDRLRALQDQINFHALKIIVYPTAQEVSHWKRELTAWGNNLAGMQLRMGKQARPMGFELPWKHLYREPFEGDEDGALRFRLQVIHEDYQRPITKPPDEIKTELTGFLRALCDAIGRQQTVGAIVNTLGRPRDMT